MSQSVLPEHGLDGNGGGYGCHELGWKLLDNRFVPLMSRINAAPDSLLKVICCNCSTACKTLRCSCRRYRLPCTTVCGPCQLEECDNPHNKFLPEESDDEDEQWRSVYYNVLMCWYTWFIGLLDYNLCHSFQTCYLGTFDDFLGARNLDRHTESIGFVH